MFERVNSAPAGAGPGLVSAGGGRVELDFSQFLQEAQEEYVPRRSPRPPARPAADEKEVAAQEGRAGEDEVEEEVEGAPDEGTAGAEEVPVEGAAPVAAAAEVVAAGGEASREVPLEEAEGGRGIIASRQPLPVGGELAPGGEELALALDGEEAAAQEAPLPEKARVYEGDPLELLAAGEAMDPDLVAERNPQQLVARLAQATGARLPSGEEAAEVLLPQVVRAVATLVRADRAEMRLQLQPADLGQIELRVRTSEAAVRGEMVVQHPETKHLLEAQMGRLRAALAAEGLQLEGFDVGVGSDPRSAPGDGRRGERARPSPAPRPGIPAPEVAAAPAPRRLDAGELDFTA